MKSFKKSARVSQVLLIAAVVALLWMSWLAFAPNQDDETQTDGASKGSWLDALFGDFGLSNVTATNGTSREVQVKYQSGTLEGLGTVKVENDPGSGFDVVGTAASGNPARFEIICGEKVCGSTQDVYQEPLTYWVVTIPPTKGLTKLAITAGAAYLEVSF